MKSLRSIATGLLFSAATLVVFDLALGLFLRDGRFLSSYVPPYDLVFTEQQVEELRASENPYGRFDPELGWTIRDDGASDDGMYRANSAGFRANREYDLIPPEGVVRIASFGDSFTHGAEVGNEDTWQHQLETMTEGVEVLNFGVNAYGVDQAYLRYRRDAVRYAPHIVLIGFLVENINRSVSVYRPAYYHQTRAVSAKPRFRVDDRGGLELLPLPVASQGDLLRKVESGELIEVLRETDYWVQRAPLAYDRSPLFLSSIFRVVYGRYESGGRDLERHYTRGEDSEPFRVTRAVIEAFYAEALEQGAERALVVFFPHQSALGGPLASEPDYWQTLVEALEAGGVPVLDVKPALLRAAQDGPLEDLFSGHHYSGKGNAAVAGAIRERLFPSGP
jgi:hypothetical protein